MKSRFQISTYRYRYFESILVDVLLKKSKF